MKYGTFRGTPRGNYEINFDKTLSKEEKLLLTEYHSEIQDHSDEFSHVFGVESTIAEFFEAALEGEEIVIEDIFWSGADDIALVQAYLFSDPKKITGERNKETATKIAELNEVGNPCISHDETISYLEVEYNALCEIQTNKHIHRYYKKALFFFKGLQKIKFNQNDEIVNTGKYERTLLEIVKIGFNKTYDKAQRHLNKGYCDGYERIDLMYKLLNIVTVVDPNNLNSDIEEDDAISSFNNLGNNFNLPIYIQKYKNIQEKDNILYEQPLQGYNFYDKYFGGQTFNQGIGNCYAVQYLDGLQDLINFEEMIEKKVKRTPNNDGFEVTLPLDDDQYNETFIVRDEYLNPQLFIDGERKTLIKKPYDKSGYAALLHAIGQQETGRTNFDISRLTGGNSRETSENLLAQRKSIFRKNTGNSEFQSDLFTCAKSFKKGVNMLSLGVYLEEGRYLKNNEEAKANHVVSVKSVIRSNNKITGFDISDPNETRGTKFLPIDEIYHFHFDIPGTKRRSPFYRDVSRRYGRELNEPERDIDHGYKKGTINQIVESQNTQNNYMRGQRGDLIVTKRNGSIHVDSRQKNDHTMKINLDQDKITYRIHGNSCTLSLSSLSNHYGVETKEIYRQSVYAPLRRKPC